MRRRSMWDLLKLYPTMAHPVDCENGCGAVVELGDTYNSYKRREDGERFLICRCCASEEGHADEDLEEPEETPVCRRKPKRVIK